MPDFTPEDDPRTEPPTTGDELATLSGFLTWQRQTFELKCADLDPDAMATRSVEPSSLSLLGLLRHLADVERGWFRGTMAGLEAPPLHFSDADPDGEFEGAIADADLVAAAWNAWREEVAFADRFVTEAPNLDVTGHEKWRGAMSLRWVLIHMIEEYARHNGHADLIRERIDGTTFQ